MNICPICGFNGLSESAYNVFKDNTFEGSYEICPSCGFETGKDEFDQEVCSINTYADDCHIKIVKEWRHQWIERGMKWEHDDEDSLKLKPKKWNPSEQLKNIPKEFL